MRLVCCWPRCNAYADSQHGCLHHTGKQVPGDTAVIANFQYQTTARAIIVIEKVWGGFELDVLTRWLALNSNVTFHHVRRMQCSSS